MNRDIFAGSLGKAVQLSTIKEHLKALLLEVSMATGSIDIENADKDFSLEKVYKKDNSFAYYVKYKDSNGKYILTKTSTGTADRREAEIFAFTHREEILKGIFERREERKNSGKNFYKMLGEYYTANSTYLLDDAANDKRVLTRQKISQYHRFIKLYFVPFFKENGITDIKDVSKQVYSNLKTYLQNIKTKKSKGVESLTIGTINNALVAFNRILQYFERNGTIKNLPYSKGKLRENKKLRKQPALLPTEFLPGILSLSNMADTMEKLYLFLLSAIGLCCGLRPNEIARIKRDDIKYVISCDSYYAKVWNHKTEFYNKTIEEEYRKIPLHKILVNGIQFYCEEKNIKKTDYIFGRVNKYGEPVLSPKHTRDAIFFFYSMIKLIEDIVKTGDLEKAYFTNAEKQDTQEKEMKEKNIVFYSLRHTFQTLLGVKFPAQSLLIDYYMGHKPQQAMLNNYLHINQVDIKTFFETYGKNLLDFQGQFMPNENETELSKQIEKKVVNGKIFSKDFDNVVNSFIPKKENGKNDNDFFESV
jgi:integrase